MTADYVVIRPAPNLPPGILPPHINGRWYDLNDVPAGLADSGDRFAAVPAGRFEVRDDGAVAEVWEVRL